MNYFLRWAEEVIYILIKPIYKFLMELASVLDRLVNAGDALHFCIPLDGIEKVSHSAKNLMLYYSTTLTGSLLPGPSTSNWFIFSAVMSVSINGFPNYPLIIPFLLLSRVSIIGFFPIKTFLFTIERCPQAKREGERKRIAWKVDSLAKQGTITRM